MPENIIIPNKKRLEELKKAVAEAGTKNFHVLADFDRTLTKAFVDGQKAHTVIAQIRNGGYLTPEYAPEAHRLFDIYRPIEIDPNISQEIKNAKMHEWWRTHFDLLIRSGLNKSVIDEVVRKKGIKFREGALSFIDYLRDKNIPLVIMSAAPGDMITEYLRQEDRLHNNVHIVANFYKFDVNGNVVSIKEPLIHSLNKHEIIIKDFPAFDLIKNRKNVLLLGDGVDDIGMIEGFEYDNLIKVGFLNENAEENLEKFKENFDVVLLGDANMDFVNNLIRELFN
ncbi:MAG: hypothetical protein WCX17_02090 [Parcubacteria group bacterium]|jgi:5'-nucleotidase